MLHLVLCTWEAENSCCWWTPDENSNLLLITDHIKTSRTCPSAPALCSPVKHRPFGCCWAITYTSPAQLHSAPPNHNAAQRKGRAAPASKGAAPWQKQVARPLGEQLLPLLRVTALSQGWTRKGSGGSCRLLREGERPSACPAPVLKENKQEICFLSLQHTHPHFPFITSGNFESMVKLVWGIFCFSSIISSPEKPIRVHGVPIIETGGQKQWK